MAQMSSSSLDHGTHKNVNLRLPFHSIVAHFELDASWRTEKAVAELLNARALDGVPEPLS